MLNIGICHNEFSIIRLRSILPKFQKASKIQNLSRPAFRLLISGFFPSNNPAVESRQFITFGF